MYVNYEDRIKMVKAMEFIARQVNDEDVFMGWLYNGVADGDIPYGEMDPVDPSWGDIKEDPAYYYVDDDMRFADLMYTFLSVMARAKKSGGLYCDAVVSNDDAV